MGIFNFKKRSTETNQELEARDLTKNSTRDTQILPIFSDSETNLKDERTFQDARQFTRTDASSRTYSNEFTDSRTLQIITNSAGARGTQIPTLKKESSVSAESRPEISPKIEQASGRSDDDTKGLDITKIALIAGVAVVGYAFVGGEF